jgi:predicted amidohydrolase
MKVAVLQFSPTRADRKANFDNILKCVNGARFDLLVLPELATTGYLFSSRDELSSLAEPFPGGPTSDFMISLSKEIGGYVVSGVAEKSGDSIYNSAVLFSPPGHVGTYRKIHLFDTEKEFFSPGNLGFPVFDIGQTKMGMMVCFDWIFPESARSLALSGARIICHCANLVLPYCPQAAVTRAVENRIFFLLANRTGTESVKDQSLTFIGKSRIISPEGKILDSIDEGSGIISAEIDTSQAANKQITPRNHILADRRPDMYNLD